MHIEFRLGIAKKEFIFFVKKFNLFKRIIAFDLITNQIDY